MFTGKFDEGPLKSRWFKQCLCPSLCLPVNCLLSPLRRLVSKSKRRYDKDGYDLDLTYITDRVIAHGFPAAGVEHLWRNPRSEIARFLEDKHKGHYKVFNFCCEPGRGYSPDWFDGRIERYPFRDHGVPPLKTMVDFTNSAKAWLDAHPDNVVSLHCKAGKGRAGTMACCLLIRLGNQQTAADAMSYYDKTRVTNNKGLTVKSQRKFVKVYERLWRENWGVKGDIGKEPVEETPGAKYSLPVERVRHLTSVEITVLPDVLKGGDFFVRVLEGTTPYYFDNVCVYQSSTLKNLQGGGGGSSSSSCSSEVFTVDCDIKDNFCVQLFQKVPGCMGEKKLRICEMWHNTSMLIGEGTEMDFGAEEINVKKQKKKKKEKKLEGLNIRLGFDVGVRSNGGQVGRGDAAAGELAGGGEVEMNAIMPYGGGGGGVDTNDIVPYEVSNGGEQL